jgi:triacylglycerol esterase/lipase EstA (alpha/beta hydrolase family)
MLAKWFTALTAATVALGSALPAPAPDASSVDLELIKRSGGGVNDWNCKSTNGKDPVIFLHGLTAPEGLNWITKAPIVAAQGYCVFTPQYGTVGGILFGFASMRDSSKEIAGIVQKVLAATGASKINLVGHSMGTTVSAYYMKFDGGAQYVNHFVGFGANYKGTSLYGVNLLVKTVPGLSDVLRSVCASCDEFLTPSTFVDDLNRGGVTVPGPDYTTIASKLDEFVLPYTSGLLDEPGVTNIVIQKQCGFILDLAGHLAQAIDPNVTAWILWALGGKQGRIPGCIPFLIPTKRDSGAVVIEA